MDFRHVRDFLESWGLHFDTRDGESSTIPYPQVYERMKMDIDNISHCHTLEEIQVMDKFISSITDTTDGETYLTSNSWNEAEEAWVSYLEDITRKERLVYSI